MLKYKKIISILLLISISGIPIFLFTRFTKSPSLRQVDSLISFNEGYGSTASDTKSSISAGTITNALWKQEDLCKTGKCLYFDGTGDYVSYADSSSLDMAASDTVTIEAWFRTPDITSGTRTLISKEEATGVDGGYRIQMNSNGKIVFGIDSNNTSYPEYGITSSSAYDDNLWHHVTAIKNGTSNMSLYIDGNSVGSISIASTAADNNDSFYIGTYYDSSSSDAWSGFIDEVKILRTARTAAEVKADFVGETPSRGTSASFGPNQSYLSDGLVGYWKMDETTNGSSRADSSGNGITLADNNSVATASGKFANGGEFVPGSSQYLSSSNTATYYFNTATPDDPDSNWINDSYAFDGSTSTGANAIDFGTEGVGYLGGGGTNAPASGGLISQVRARMYVFSDCIPSYCDMFGDIYDGATALGDISVLGEGYAYWGNYTNLSAPTGGWTWAKLQTLYFKGWVDNNGAAFNGGVIYRIEIEVTSSGGTIPATKTVSFWTNPDNSTNYYLSLTSGAYITSSSGTLSATGFTNPKIYVNGVQTNTIIADTWQLVTVTSDTAITANQFYIGKQDVNYFDGTMDEVRLYNRVLSPVEISRLYNWGPGPVGEWKMDENTGTTANDISGNANNGTLTGKGRWSSGKYGSGFYTFNNGVKDFVDVGDPASGVLDFSNTQDFTYEVWFKYGSSSDSYIVPFEKGGSSLIRAGYDFEVNATTSNAICNYSDGNGAGTSDEVLWSGSNILDKNWHHIACVRDYSGNGTGTAGFHLFVDGVRKATTARASFTEGDGSGSARSLYLGEAISSYPNTVSLIDDVKVYNYARSASQIVSDMNAGHPAPGSPVGSAIAHWKFDEGYGTTANDSGTSHSDLVLSSASWNNSGKFNKAWNGTGANWLCSQTAGSCADDNDFNFTAADDFSLSVWAKHDTQTGSTPTTVTRSTAGTTAWVAPPGVTSIDVVARGSGGGGGGVAVDTSKSSGGGAGGAYAASTGVTVIPGNTYNLTVGTAGTAGAATGGNGGDGGASSFGTTLVVAEGGAGGQSYENGKAGGNGSTASSTGNTLWPGGDAGDGGDDNTGGGGGEGAGSTSAGGSTTTVTGGTGTDGGTGGDGGTNNPGLGGTAPGGGGGGAGTSSTSNRAGGAGALGSVSITYNLMDEYLISKYDGTNGGYRLYMSARKYCFTIDDDASWTPDDAICTTNNYDDNAWHHVVATKTGTSKIDLYVDGVLQNTKSSLTATATLANSGTLYLGDLDGVNNGDEYIGSLDEAKIYNLALTADQVKVEYNYGAGTVMGSLSTTSTGVSSNSSTDSYCPPGQGSTCTGPVGEWKMDENTGTTTTYDTSGNGLNLTLTTSPVWDVGKFGSGIRLNGNNNYLNGSTSNTLDMRTGSFSAFAWVKAQTTASIDDTVFQKGAGNSTMKGYFLNANNGNGLLQLGISDGSSYIVNYLTGTTNVGDGTWHYVGFTWNPAVGAKIYVDGIMQNSAAVTSSIDITNTSENFLIGGYGGTDYSLNGIVDETKVYNYDRIPAQIAWDYNRGGPQGWWKFDENTGTTAYDASGNGYNSQTFVGSTAYTTGKLNTALTFDGTDDVVKVTEGTGIDFGTTTDSYSVSAWFKTSTNYNVNATIVAKDDGSGAYPYYLYLDSSEQACFQIYDGTNTPSVCGSTALNNGSWHHLIGIRDVTADKIYLYVDGVQIKSTADTTTATTANNDNVSFGASGTSYTANDFNGQIDDVRIYNYPLTQEQINLITNDNSAVKF